MEYILFALVVMGLVTSAISSEKGHPAIAWFLLGLLLGPLGVLWALLNDRTPQKEAERQIAIDAARQRLLERPND